MLPRILLIVTLALAGCNSRPGPEVLTPDTSQPPAGARIVRVLAVTTRAPEAQTPGSYGATRAASPGWLSYEVSVPPGHQPGQIEWPDRSSSAARNFVVRSQTPLSREGFAKRLPREGVGLYIHGFNTRFHEALFRTAQLSVDAHMEEEPILFTWPSAGNAGAYLADRDASDFSRAALADLLRLLTKDRSVSKPVPVLAHSMGARLTMETLVQLRLAGRGDVLDRIELILAAPDIDIDLFRAQMASVGKMRHPITVLVASDDPALKISSRLAARRMRLGLADVHDPAIQRLAVESGIRIIDITEVETRDPAHSRYVGLISGEAGTAADVTLFGEIRQAGAFVFNQFGGALNSIGGALAE
ncbi:alpha/beta hydrolase [Paracoccus aminophilus]|uniref:Lipoprotein n=1 Tax=Paracoccus aminophilus JCM 7686 TaxID=1367847 RepID=S5XW04_PARAH|nr:alpha/beta hydrolase [Paracoccus aminophilus]AGT11689.1 hypothetical protein JCM7686_pAMI8p191 [Paracoccus aminophilus JCM 7686]